MQLPRIKSAFHRNVLTLAGGTALAQLSTVLASPILTRLYEPTALGHLALYLAVVTIGAVVVTGRYELAILIPGEDSEAGELLAVAVLSAFATTALLTAVVASAGFYLADSAWMLAIPEWSVVVPIGITLAATTQSLIYWTNRRADYRQLVASRLTQTGSMLGVQTLTGAVSARGGLIGGHLVGLVVAVLSLARNAWRTDRDLFKAISWVGMKRTARLHRRFPIFIAPGHLANVASSQLPTILLATLFGPSVAGLYAVAERVLVLPTSLIATSIGNVYRREAAETYNRIGNCRILYLRTLGTLAALSAVPCATVIVAGPALFAFAFGNEWRQSGAMASILAAMVYFQMLSSPLSQTVLLANMHRLELLWQLARFLMAGGSIYVGYVVFSDPMLGIALYAAAFSVLHVLHSLMQYHAASGGSAFASNERPTVG